MRVVVQRVRGATLHVGGTHRADSGPGIVVLAAIEHDDTREDLQWMAGKLVNLRIFQDENGLMNRSVLDARGGIMLVPNFTVAGDCRRGRRPSFSDAMTPDRASPMFDDFAAMLEASGAPVSRGVFGADMLVEIRNDGPVTLILESPRRDAAP